MKTNFLLCATCTQRERARGSEAEEGRKEGGTLARCTGKTKIEESFTETEAEKS